MGDFYPPEECRRYNQKHIPGRLPAALAGARERLASIGELRNSGR